MTGLLLACLWIVAAHVVALIPSRRHHWPQAWVLIVAGLPILALVVRQSGWLAGLAVLAAGCSVLRWPVYFLWLRVRRILAGR